MTGRTVQRYQGLATANGGIVARGNEEGQPPIYGRFATNFNAGTVDVFGPATASSNGMYVPVSTDGGIVLKPGLDVYTAAPRAFAVQRI